MAHKGQHLIIIGSHEAAEADANMVEIARLRAALDQAHADMAALMDAWRALSNCPECDGAGTHWTDIDGEAEPEPCAWRVALDDWLRAFERGEHPGALRLLAELDAARAALAWYADAEHYTDEGIPIDAFMADRGSRARSALEATKAPA